MKNSDDSSLNHCFSEIINSHETYKKMPNKKLSPNIISDVKSAFTGPEKGCCWNISSPKVSNHPMIFNEINYNSKTEHTYGVAVSLYEQDFDQTKLAGDPIADVFGIVSRPNCTFMALADGCGWGTKSQLAARCAVKGALDRLNENLAHVTTTHEMYNSLIKAMSDGHNMIINNNATLTTLIITAICEIAPDFTLFRGQTREWIAITLSVGDCTGYVYSSKNKTVTPLFEPEERLNLCDAGGCLGPHIGYDPDLSNISASYIRVEKGDIVYLVSDGISDNFDKNVNQNAELAFQCLPASPVPSRCHFNFLKTVPATTPAIREGVQLKMAEVINNYFSKQGSVSTAQEVCVSLANFAISSTNEKRGMLEDVSRNCISKRDLQTKNPEMFKRLKSTSGKLDHATVVGTTVGVL